MTLLFIESASETLGSPTATFVLLLAIALLIPPIFEHLKLPGLVGLLAAGVLFGNSMLGWLDPDSETMKLLSDIGKTYLMFVAGLEIDLALFQKTRNRSLSFGLFTFAIPFISGIGVGLVFNFGWLAAVLIGSLLASHTLLAYPIVQRLGVVSDEAVTVTVGATIFTDIAALLVLAICLGVSKGDFTVGKLLFLLGSLGIYAITVLLGLKPLAVSFFRANGTDEGSQFLFVMLSVFLAAVTAQLIGVEGIIGAFLAGLAINSVISSGPVKEKTEFVGSVLFIPMFFINMGLLLDLAALGNLLKAAALPLSIVAVLLGSKLLATLATKLLFGYSWPQTWTMWSLSIPQVAATLAAALVGYEANIINVEVFNSVILLMLVTSILGPLVTARTARNIAQIIALSNAAEKGSPLSWLPVPTPLPLGPTVSDTFLSGTSASSPLPSSPTSSVVNSNQLSLFSVVVPIYNPKTERWLLELAATVAQYERGRVIPLAVALAQSQMDSRQMRRGLIHSRRRLKAADAIHEQYPVPIDPVLRIEYSVAHAICHVSREKDANLIVLGIGEQSKLRVPLQAPLSNPIYDDVLWAAHCPVVVARLLASPAAFKNILLPIDTLSPFTIRVLRFAQVLAAANQGRVTLLYVCDKATSHHHQSQMVQSLHQLIAQLPPAPSKMGIQITESSSWVEATTQIARQYDVVVVRSQRRRASSGLSLGTLTQPLLDQLNSSVILVGEPSLYRPR